MRRRFILPVLLVWAAVAGPSAADDPPAPWQPDEVARVLERSVTWTDLCVAAADASLPRLQDEGSVEHWAFLAVAGDLVLAPLCAKHGVEVTDADVTARWKAEDEQARQRTGRGLLAGLESRGRPAWSKRREIRRRLEVQGLEALGVKVQAALDAADVRAVVPVGDRAKAAELPPGIVATVDGASLTDVMLGTTVLAHAGARPARELLERACRIALAEARGVRLEPAAMDPELERLTRLAPLEALFDAEEVWEQLRVRGGVERKETHTRSWFRNSPYAQVLFGLVQRFREAASSEEVQAVWERERESTFGAHVRVIDVEITFRTRGDVFATGPDRSRAEALRMAREIRAEHARGVPFDAIAARIREARTPGFTAEPTRLYATARSRILLDAAMALEDGEVSRPVETLSEVHVLCRERMEPAPRFEAIEPVVRERLARKRTRQWLEQQVADPACVRVRWPLPQLR